MGISFKDVPLERIDDEEKPLPIKSLGAMSAELADPVMDGPIAPQSGSVAPTATVVDLTPIKRSFLVSLEHNPVPEVIDIEAPANADWTKLATDAFYKKKGIWTSATKPKVMDHGQPAPVPAP